MQTLTCTNMHVNASQLMQPKKVGLSAQVDAHDVTRRKLRHHVPVAAQLIVLVVL